MDKVWLKEYPSGVAHEIDPDQYTSLLDLMDEGFAAFRTRAAYMQMGKPMSFGQLDELSKRFAAYLQSLGLAKGVALRVRSLHMAGEVLDDLPDFDQSDADLRAEAARAAFAREALLSVAAVAAEHAVVLL